ncbi:hypothetical protein [Undibacterium sp. TJN19]|uniref:hypothetical protein n=1 Tax=Undibacterium sp. TJN19 TaxID=3413055 RepID=UPI003BF18078
MIPKIPHACAAGITVVCHFLGKWLYINFDQPLPVIDENDITTLLFLCSWLQVLQRRFVKKQKEKDNK